MKRRDFIQGSLFGAGLLFGGLPVRLAFGSPRKRGVLVFVFQRGACDGLSLIPPLRDSFYHSARPDIAIAPADALPLTADFGLHPACAPLSPLIASGHLAFVPYIGSPDPTRSHFDAQDYMEIGTPGRKATEDGFLNRALAALGKPTSALAAVALQGTMPRSLQGSVPALATGSLKEFQLRGVLGRDDVAAGFEGIYEQALNQTLRGASQETFSALHGVKSLLDEGATKVIYPKGKLASALRDIAALVKGNLGLELAVTEIGGWDTHVNQGSAKGQLANHLEDWSGALAAFADDLGPHREEVLLLSVTEFGRTVRQNGSGGTDHGHGAVFTVLAPGLKRKVIGEAVELREANLYEGRDVPQRHDFRDLFAAALRRQWGIRDFAKVFPGYKAREAFSELA